MLHRKKTQIKSMIIGIHHVHALFSLQESMTKPNHSFHCWIELKQHIYLGSAEFLRFDDGHLHALRAFLTVSSQYNFAGGMWQWERFLVKGVYLGTHVNTHVLKIK